jgi:4-carboxymuconolactone decarboxylase
MHESRTPDPPSPEVAELGRADPPQTSRDLLREIVPELARLTESVLLGDIWERPQLSKRDRSLITVAALAALYRGDELRSHMERALDNGVTRDELAELITHVAFYGGCRPESTRPELPRVSIGHAATVRAS